MPKSASTESGDSVLGRLAARLEPGMRRAFLAAARAAVESISDDALAAAVREGDLQRVEHAAGLDVFRRDLHRKFPPLVGRAYAAGAALGSVRLDAGANQRAARAPAAGSSLKGLANPEVIAWVQQHGAELVTEVSDTARLALRDAILTSQQYGIGPDALVPLIRRLVGLHSRQVTAVENFWQRLSDQGVAPDEVARRSGRYAAALLNQRALLIARTETIRAASEGQQETWRRAVRDGYIDPEQVVRVWNTAEDERVCVTCEALDGAEAPLDGLFPGGYMLPPDPHPACLLGSAVVDVRSQVLAATYRRFEGEIVVLRCAGGNDLRATPNHPVLTPTGWRAAGDLRQGDYLIRVRSGERVLPAVDADEDHAPTFIKEIAKTFRRAPRVAGASVPVSAEDFHGDGVGSKVAIVWSNCALNAQDQTALSEEAAQFDLVLTAETGGLLPGQGCGFKLASGVRSSSTRVVGGSDLLSALRRAHARPLDEFGVTTAAHRYASSGEVLRQGLAADAALLRDLVDRLSGTVVADQVVEVKRVPFHGHVYNLQTSDGWYVANGIITHNCRCDITLRFL